MHAGAQRQRVASLMLQTLKAYPLMMARHGTLPPFIHPSLVAAEPELEPLTNCISLVHMLGSGLRGSRRLFWRNVRVECERFVAQATKLSKWELVTAMQAIFVYVLVRLDEGEREYNNLDCLLVRAMAVVTEAAVRHNVTHWHCALCNAGREPTWKEWIFRESGRRLAVLYRIINMLIFCVPASVESECSIPSGLVLAPLPAPKSLWEAADERAWRAETRRQLRGGRGGSAIQTAFGLAVDGKLVKLEEGRLSCTDQWLPYTPSSAPGDVDDDGAAEWAEWCAGLDAFGGLVMLAASLVV